MFWTLLRTGPEQYIHCTARTHMHACMVAAFPYLPLPGSFVSSLVSCPTANLGDCITHCPEKKKGNNVAQGPTDGSQLKIIVHIFSQVD